MNNLLRNPASLVSILGCAAGTLMLISKASSVGGALFFVPFALGPLLLNAFLAALCLTRSAKVMFSFVALAYFAWFAWAYLDMFYWHPDPQSAIGLLFVGIYSLPVVVPAWIIALVLQKRETGLKANLGISFET